MRMSENTCAYNFSTSFCIVCDIVINKFIFISSLALRLSMRFLLVSLISLMHRSITSSSFLLCLGHCDTLSIVFVFKVDAPFGPSGLFALECACDTTFARSNINSSTSKYHLHFSDHCDPLFKLFALSSL